MTDKIISDLHVCMSIFSYICYLIIQLQVISAHHVCTGCPKRYETFLNLNKIPTFKFCIPKFVQI